MDGFHSPHDQGDKIVEFAAVEVKTELVLDDVEADPLDGQEENGENMDHSEDSEFVSNYKQEWNSPMS
jgi:hypothetical protein